MVVQLAENNLAKVEWKVSQSSQKPSQGLPAIWIVVDEEDWSGVNDCGAIHKPDSIDSVSPLDDESDWPIESCS
jgi:hypothetical protein